MRKGSLRLVGGEAHANHHIVAAQLGYLGIRGVQADGAVDAVLQAARQAAGGLEVDPNERSQPLGNGDLTHDVVGHELPRPGLESGRGARAR